MSENLKLSNAGSSCTGAVGEDYLSSASVSNSAISQGNREYQWARFLRELAGVLVLYLNIPDQAWVGLLKKVGLSQIDVDEVTTQDLDSEIQVYKLLSKSKQNHNNPNRWWSNFSEEVNDFGNDRPGLIKAVQRAYDKFITCDMYDTLESATSLPIVEVVCTSPKAVSQSFELIDEEEVIKSSEDMKLKLKEEIEVMDPGTTQRINELQRTVQEVAKEANSKLAIKLAVFVTDTLHLENTFRATKTLNNILERENEGLKKNFVRLTKENENMSRELDTLRQENEELKKTKADQQLTEFDVITKREASQAHDDGSTQKSVPIASAAITDETNVVSLNAYKELQGRCLKVTSQRDQLVKVNHQWDEEYHLMETALRAEYHTLCQTIMEKDEEIMAGKRLIVAMEKEKAGCEQKASEVGQDLDTIKRRYEPLQEKYNSEKEKCRKYHEYAIRLKDQKDKLEKEIARLNQVLSDETLLKKNKAAAGKTSSAAQNTDFETELIVYRQQAELYEKDFKEEQREKRVLVTELKRTKEDLHNMKKKIKKMNEKVQMYQDERMAQQLQEGIIPENRYSNRNRSKNDRLVPHSGLNYAGNDQFVDAGPLSSFGSIEEDRIGEGDSEQEDQENNVCPRCKVVFVEDREFHNHLGECLTE